MGQRSKSSQLRCTRKRKQSRQHASQSSLGNSCRAHQRTYKGPTKFRSSGLTSIKLITCKLTPANPETDGKEVSRYLTVACKEVFDVVYTAGSRRIARCNARLKSLIKLENRERVMNNKHLSRENSATSRRRSQLLCLDSGGQPRITRAFHRPWVVCLHSNSRWFYT